MNNSPYDESFEMSKFTNTEHRCPNDSMMQTPNKTSSSIVLNHCICRESQSDLYTVKIYSSEDQTVVVVVPYALKCRVID